MPATSAPANGTCCSYQISPTATNLLEKRHKCPRKTNDYRTETLSCLVKPHPDSPSPPTPPVTPAIMMEVTVEGHTITAQELRSDDWTPPPPAAARRRPAYATKETRLTVQRSKQLPPLPPNAIRVVVHPRGELRLLDVPTARLTKAVQTQLRITLPADFCLRTHPTNNTFSVATTHSPTAETLKTLTSLAIGDQTYPCTAYVAPPPGSTRGAITSVYDDETPTQLYQDLVRRNTEYTILAARRMGKTHSILITFDANAVPHSIKCMGAIHRCTLYHGSPDACTNCRQLGHRHDVFPSPTTNLCPRCGTQHSQQEPPCTPKCIMGEGPHLTGTGSCKGRNLHQPRKQPSHPETQEQESVPLRDSFPKLSSRPTQPNQHKQAWTEPLKQAWNTPLSSHKHTTAMTVNPSLQHVLAKSQEEAAAAKAEATAARAEAAALRQCIAKLEAQISALATGSTISPTQAPTAPQPPTLNPPNDHTLPSHSNPTSSPDSLAMEADTEPATNSTPCTTPPPSTPISLDDIPALLEAARTVVPITDITDWSKQLESDVRSVTRPLREDCPSDTVDSRLLRLWEAKAGLERRWQRQRWN
ncbi:hypothetical protein HPB49_003551 [Dermacentor silvarum]|uniref:Uncharacterized protein n=1 Tax=Dermacentor silvarum TaxID=543639 RepID=A0ACB8CDD1_DERSI|nr:hypothetical protein HPB49_003551 [Dermacentor silvarum]